MSDIGIAGNTRSDPTLAALRRLDGGLLLVLRELLRTGSTTEAARRLALSQSAVSHALGRLREIFDDELFLRLPHGLRPTRRALALAPGVEQLLALASDLLAERRRFDPATARREFCLSAPEFVAATVGAALLRRVSASAPGCTVRIEHLDDDEAINRLALGSVDVALGRFDPAVASASFERRVLYRDDYCLAARRGHPELAQGVTAEGYVGLVHVFASAESELSSRESTMSIEALQVFSVPRWLTALAIVATSDGVATCSRRLADTLRDVLALDVLPLPFGTEPIEVSLVRPRDLRDPGSRWFEQQIVEVIDKDA